MAVPARNDSTDHLLITAHLYWLTGGDGEGSKGIQYTERQLTVHTKTRKCQCMRNTEDRGRYLVNKTHTHAKAIQIQAHTHKGRYNGKTTEKQGLLSSVV